MNGAFYRFPMQEAFDCRSPRYRDWVLYADQARFQTAPVDDFASRNRRKLQANGVDVGQMLFSTLGDISGEGGEKVA